MPDLYFGFDSQVFSYLQTEDAAIRDQAIQYFAQPRHHLLPSGVNVLEAACCPSVGTRTSLLRLMSSLSGGVKPLALVGDLLRGQVDDYAFGRPFTTITIGEEQRGLWIALESPEDIGGEDVQEANQFRESQELEFREMHKDARPHFQELVKSGGANGITSRSRLIRHYREDPEFLESMVAQFTRVSPSAYLLRGRELEFIQNRPCWQCFFLANAAAVYLRAVQPQNYGRRKNAGYFDLAQAVYLPFCHVYVTNDKGWRNVVRLVAAAMSERPYILTYGELKDIILRGFDPSSWCTFPDKGFRLQSGQEKVAVS
ncbi:MAG: hypothetical protein ACYDA9_17800 [Terriglobia bacterium]